MDKKDKKEKKTSFVVKIQFTRNSTWQGEITWLEEQKTQIFRSELEMIKLMDEAISSNSTVEMSDWQNG